MRFHHLLWIFPAAVCILMLSTCREKPPMDSGAVVRWEFIYETAPYPSAHASTVIETGGSIAAAWFGGTAEGDPDVGIWFSWCEGGRWSIPVEAANGNQPDGGRLPCWNPVLFQPTSGPLLLFYKVGPNPREWWGLARISEDGGRSWSEAAELPSGTLGPIRAKPVQLKDGSLLAGSSTEHSGWTVHMERFSPPKITEAGAEAPAWSLESLSSAGAWSKTGTLNDPGEFGAIQPAILVHSQQRLQILCRSRQGFVTEAWSADGGRTWDRMSATQLPNPNAGIDVTRLRDGRFLLVYNPTAQGRDKLALALSSDGREWRNTLVLEDSPGEYSYPAQIQARDGLVHITYTWKRKRIKHVVIDPSRLQ